MSKRRLEKNPLQQAALYISAALWDVREPSSGLTQQLHGLKIIANDTGDLPAHASSATCSYVLGGAEKIER